MKALTIRQPWADLIMAGVKDVENRTWPVPSTLSQWYACTECDHRMRQSLSHLTPKSHYAHHPSGIGGEWHKVEPDGPFPATIAVHAASRVTIHDYNRAILRVPDPEAVQWVRGWREHRDQTLGAIVGTVDLTSDHKASGRDCYLPNGAPHVEHQGAYVCSPWGERSARVHHWMLANPQLLGEPVPAKGMLGLWRLTDDQVAAVRDRVVAA